MMDTQLPVRRRPLDPMSQAYVHSRSRTTSSNVLPNTNAGHASRLPPEPEQPSIVSYGNRSPSVNTFSTVSSGMAPPAAYRTSPPTNDQVRRSTSSRSGGAASTNTAPCQTSYVALLRRQKATVWSERAQFEDPRFAAQQKAARMRAQQIVGSGGVYAGGRTSTGLSAGGKGSSKIRHGAKGATLGFGVDSNYVGIGGVPLRLSATEVEAEDSDEDDLSAAAARAAHHRRTGSSGRSSTASGRRGTPLRTSSGALASSGSGVNLQAAAASAAANGANSRRYSPNETPERAGSFLDGDIVGGRDDAASGTARSTASGSSNAERGDHVPDLGAAAGRMPANSAAHAKVTRERSVRNAEDLRRRGSVDERSMTMTTGRLFIANPD